MKRTTRREVLLGGAGATLGLAGAAAAQAPAAKEKKPRAKRNSEPVVASKASAEEHGPSHLFAVVDADGVLKRGMHASSVRVLDEGIYEVVFRRDVRRGVYLVTVGGHGYAGLPPVGSAGVVGRATNARAVVVSTTNAQGENVKMGFHLLVVCPQGYA
jgi:hypothetical protein